MASGVEDIKVIVAVAYNEEVIILDLPLRIADMVDNGLFLEDNACFTNTNIIPRKVGVYELICKHHWDNGCSLFECTEGDIEVKILKVNELYVSKTDLNIAI